MLNSTGRRFGQQGGWRGHDRRPLPQNYQYGPLGGWGWMTEGLGRSWTLLFWTLLFRTNCSRVSPRAEVTRVWVRRHQPTVLDTSVKLTEEFVEVGVLKGPTYPFRGHIPGRKDRDLMIKTSKKKREDKKETCPHTVKLWVTNVRGSRHLKRDCPIWTVISLSSAGGQKPLQNR